MARVLVVDDEPQIVRALRINLRARSYEVSTAATGPEALDVAAKHPPDLVLLDLGLPGVDGIDVIRGLRGWTSVPIIVLSGRADSTDKVEALDAGADDYVTKPFAMEELLARMRATSRRASPREELPRIRLGELTVDLAAKRVRRDADTGDSGEGSGADVHLTPTEWHLLEVLLRNPGKLLTRRQLLNEVWGPGYADATGNLRLYMLITEPGMGYRYQPGPEESTNCT
jgi:two-component system KDP operon response regulator KdpE